MMSTTFWGAVYAACLWTLVHTVWWASWVAVPDRCRGGVRLLWVSLGAMALNAAIVQTLGISGHLRTGPYVAVCAAVGICSFWRLRGAERPSLGRLLRHQALLWVRHTSYGLGLLGLGWMGYAAMRGSLVEGIDPLSIHGPLIVGWIQSGTIPLLWPFNYPICWELQFAPAMMILGSDLLVVLPRVWIACTLLLAVKEVSSQLGLGARIGQLVAWIVVSLPFVFGVHGEGAIKSDPALAVGLLVCLLALGRLWSARSGGFTLLALGCFLVLGTKSTGIVLSAGFLGLGAALLLWRHRQEVSIRRILLAGLGLTVFFATPLALPLKNFWVNGSPFFPIVVELAGVQLPGEATLKGTSILENRHEHPHVWSLLISGARHKIGWDFQPAWSLFALGALFAGVFWLRNVFRVGLKAAMADRLFLSVAYAGVTAVLWVMFVATPWTAGLRPGTLEFVSGGNSLRYALAQIALTYVLATVAIQRVLGGRRPGGRRTCGLLALMLPLVLWERWYVSFSRLAHWTGHWKTYELLFLFFLGLVGLWIVGRMMLWIDRRLPRRRRAEVWPILFTAFAVLALPLFAKAQERLRLIAWGKSPTEAVYADLRRYISDQMPPGTTIGSNLKPIVFNYSYFLYRSDFKNRIEYVPTPLGNLHRALPDDIEYFYLSYFADDAQKLARGIDVLTAQGWDVVAEVGGDGGALLRRGEFDPNSDIFRLFTDGFESGDLSQWPEVKGADPGATGRATGGG